MKFLALIALFATAQAVKLEAHPGHKWGDVPGTLPEERYDDLKEITPDKSFNVADFDDAKYHREVRGMAMAHGTLMKKKMTGKV